MTASGPRIPSAPVGLDVTAGNRGNGGPGNAKRADLERRTAAYLDQLGDGIGRIDVTEVAAVAHRLAALSQRGGVGYVFGNGGSASTAAHFANDIHRTTALGGPTGLRV